MEDDRKCGKNLSVISFRSFNERCYRWSARLAAMRSISWRSASQASNLFTVAQYDGKEASLKQSLGRTLVASIGPVCSAALRKLAVRVDIEAQPPKLGPFIEAINAALSERRPLSKS